MWPAYLINLDQDKRRLDRASDEFRRAGVAWERHEAVDGRKLERAELLEHYDFEASLRHARYPLVAGEVGCYLSHRSVWKRIVDTDAPGGVVLEDDFKVVGDLGAVIDAIGRDTGDWDIAKLFSFKAVTFEGETRRLTSDTQIGWPTRVPSTTLGYAITKDGARRALHASERFFRPIDEDHKFFWELGLRIAAVDPSVIAIGEQETPGGTIGAARRKANAEDPRSAVRQFWINLRYRWRYNMGLRRARAMRQ